MRFTIGVYPFNEAVKNITGFAGAANEAKEMQCILVEADGDEVKLTAQNKASWVHVPIIGATIHEEGATLIPAADLRRWLAVCPTTNPLEVELVGDQIKMRTGKSKCDMSVLDPIKFPQTPNRGAVKKSVMIPGGDFIRAITSVMFAINKKDNIAHTRTDALIVDIGVNDIGFVGSDGKAISVVVLDINGPNEPVVELVPSANFNLLTPMVEGGGDVRIELSTRYCVIETERMEFGTRLLEAKGMPWRKVLKAWDLDRPEKTWLPAKEMLAGVRQVAAADPEDLRMEVRFSIGMATLSNKKSEAVVEIPACISDMKFAVDYEYLIDFFQGALRQSLNSTIEWGINDNRNQSIILRAGKDWRYMLVPLAAGVE